MIDREESFVKNYFGSVVVAYTTKNSLEHYPSFPWRFRIYHKDRKIEFYGIPNYVETKAKALKRAWYRAKWLVDGTYDKRYK